MSTIATAVNADRRIETFALSADGNLWHAWEPRPRGARWKGWLSLGGGPMTEIVVGRNHSGALGVLGVSGGKVQYIHQVPSARGWSEWIELGGPGVTRIAVAAHGDGRLEALGIAAVDGALWSAYQQSPGGPWSEWRRIGGASRSAIAAGRSVDGTLAVFATALDGGTQMLVQIHPTGGITTSPLPGPGLGRLAMATNADGRLEVFGVDRAGALWHLWQLQPGVSGWSSWHPLGNQGITEISVGANADGRLDVFALVGGGLQHIYQDPKTRTGWSGWLGLGGLGPLEQLAASPSPDSVGALTVVTSGGGRATARIQQDSGTSTGWGPWVEMGALGQQRIAHVVVVMLENRGFDSVLGHLYTRASPPRNIIPPGPPFQGLDGAEVPSQTANRAGRTISGKPTPSVIGANSPGKDPGEPYAHVNMQLFRSRAAPAPGQVPTMDGFLQDYSDVLGGDASDAQCLQILRMFTPADMPVLDALAATYAVSDQWFCSVPTQTNANRAFSICGTSLGEVDNGYYPAGVRGWVFEADEFKAPTIWNVLDRAGVSWGVYYNEPYPPIPPYEAPYTWIAFPEVQKIPSAWQHFHKLGQFFADAEAGKLPAFSYIEPKWGGETSLGYVDGNDYHPPGDITHSELMLKQIYQALRGNAAAWQQTLLVVLFDEHGGTYDHVPPPWGAMPPWGDDPNPRLPKPRQYGFNFDRFGARVPCLLASPWIAPGTVVRSNTGIPFDHTSLLASILQWQGIDRRTCLGARVAAAPTFWHALTLSSPTTDDDAFPTIHGPAPGTPLSFGRPFLLRHKQSGRFVAAASETLHWYPTLGGTGVELELRGGYGPVVHQQIVQIRTGELQINGIGAMDKPANTLGAWKDAHDVYYYPTDAHADHRQQSFQLSKPGAQPRDPICFGDEVAILSNFPDFLGQALTPSGNYLTTRDGADDTWVITPLP